ncbi:hypothetical protein D3C72_1837800 [compost metagenome]
MRYNSFTIINCQYLLWFLAEYGRYDILKCLPHIGKRIFYRGTQIHKSAQSRCNARSRCELDRWCEAFQVCSQGQINFDLLILLIN